MADKPEKEVAAPRETKRSPNRLVVDEAHGEGDNSCVMLSLAKMEGDRFPARDTMQTSFTFFLVF